MGIVVSGLDPTVARLATAAGLLTRRAGSGEAYELQADWFLNPVGKAGEAIKNDGAALGELVGQVLGSIGGQALGMPARQPGDLGTWYPILNPDSGQPTGLYFTSRTANGATVFGLGINHTWQATGGITVRAWGLAPLLATGGGGFRPAFGQNGFALTAGIEVTGDAPMVDQLGISLEGMRLGASLLLQPAPVAEVSLVAVRLKLPGEAEPSDRSLGDLQHLTGAQLLTTFSTMCLTAVSEALGGGEPRLEFVLSALGLTPKLPATVAAAFPRLHLPLLRWDQLGAAFAAGDPSRPFKTWFNELLATPVRVQAWLSCLFGLLHGPAVPRLGGTGTRADPFTVQLLDGVAGTLTFTLGSNVDGAGARTLYPGLSFAGKKTRLAQSSMALRMAATLELGEFRLSTSGVSASPASLRFVSGCRLVGLGDGAGGDAPLFAGSIAGEAFEFGALQAGLRIGESAAALTVVPAFVLEDVVTPDGRHRTLDLLQPGQVIQQAEALLIGYIDTALQQLFAAAGAHALGVVLGVLPPSLFQVPVPWPANLAPPFSAAQLAAALKDPVAALRRYYAALLDPANLVAGQRAFFHLLRDLADLLLVTAPALVPAAIAGSGSAADPWRAVLTTPGLPAAVLNAWTLPVDGGQRLVVTLSLRSRLTLAGGLAVELDFNAGLATLDFTGSRVHAQVMSEASVDLRLPAVYQTPALGGAALRLGPVALRMGWLSSSGWDWTMHAASPVLVLGGTEYPLPHDLDFRDRAALEALVRQQAPTFAPFLQGVLGVAMLRAEVQLGLALNGLLGLLPDVRALLPAELAWPPGMPALTLRDLDDVPGALRAQIQALTGNPDRLRATSRLIAWAAGGAPAAAALSGAGTLDDPLQIPAGLASLIGLGIWTDGASSSIGLGLDRSVTTALPAGLQAVTRCTVRLGQIKLPEGPRLAQAGVPGARLVCTFSQSGAALIAASASGVSLGSLAVGLGLAVDEAGPEPRFTVTPIFELRDLVLPGAASIARINLAEPGALDPALLQQAFDEGWRKIQAGAMADPAFAEIYGLLVRAGFALPAETPGINPAAWRALLADPLAFAGERLLALCADPETQAALFKLLRRATGVTPPALPESVRHVLAAVGLLQDAVHGFAPVPGAWVRLLARPASYLETALRALMADLPQSAALRALLQPAEVPEPFGPFELAVLAGPVVRISLRAGTARVGELFEVAGQLELDLHRGAERFRLELRISSPQLGLALTPTLAVDLATARSAFAAALAFGDGSAPAPAPLVVYPFDQAAFLDALARSAPAYVLSVLVSEVIDPNLIRAFPFARVLFEALGIAEKNAAGTSRTKSLLGLFERPRDWLLGDAVLGRNGQLNVARLESLLANLPELNPAAPTPGAVKIPHGIRITRLPYQTAIELTADPAAGQVSLRLALGAPLSVANGFATVEAIDFGLVCGADFQPAVHGLLTVATQGAGVRATAGYNRGFFLSAAATGAGGPLFELVPFGGWQKLATQAGQLVAGRLVPQLMAKLLQALAEHGAADFAAALRTAGTGLSVANLLDRLVAAPASGAAVEAAALAWLGERLAAPNVAATAQAVLDLLRPLGLDLAAQGGLIRFQPGATVPLQLLFGSDAANLLGAWVTLDLQGLAAVNIGFDRTGLGVRFDPATGVIAGAPEFNFGLTVALPIRGEDRSPTLTLAFAPAASHFVGGFDLLGRPGARSHLYCELFPDFFGRPANWPAALANWLLEVVKQAAPRYLAIILLRKQALIAWLDGPLLGTTPGAVLAACGLLKRDGANYSLSAYDDLRALTIEKFVAGLLKALLSSEHVLATFNNGKGSLVLGPRSPGSAEYGLRLAARDLALPGTPQFVFQVGALDVPWIAEAGGPAAPVPGLGVFVPIPDTPRFAELKLELMNIGVDFVGRNGQPLVHLSRFSLGAVRPRAALVFDFANPSPLVLWGGEVTLSDVGLALAPKAITTNTNPIAQNLLGAGPTGSTGQSSTTNPSFSASVGYLSPGHLSVRLLQGNEREENKIWFDVERKFGPLSVERLGVEWRRQQERLGLMFDGSVALAGLFVGVRELTVSLDVRHPTELDHYGLDLAGLAIAFQSGPAELSGALYKQNDPLRYDGAAMLRLAAFSLDALGSYGLVPVDPNRPDGSKAASLFVFVNLNMPLGGPPIFFVMGLAAGFGFNRDIILPEPGAVASFPMVRGAMDGSFFSKNGNGQAGPTDALKAMANAVPPRLGSYWIAAGVKFTSFALIDSFVLLFVKFGKEFEVDLIGVSQGSLPPKLPVRIAYFELGLVISFKPAAGYLSVQAQLTPNSFVLAPPCKLTGGFALVLWFSGDFVLSIGGYHPAYHKPEAYPDVPRLGFVWPIDFGVGSLSVYGAAYFALTPTAIMSGGILKVVFKLGPIRAWLDAGANFLIQWKPFYYDIEIHIEVGVEFHTRICGISITLSASLGAGMQLWGPETAGLVHVSWFVVSFTIPIGKQDRDLKKQPLKRWQEFADSFLPKEFGAAPAGEEEPATVVMKPTAPAGMLAEKGPHGWLISPSSWKLRMETVVPASSLAVANSSEQYGAGVPMGIRPMNLPSVNTPLAVRVDGLDTGTGAWVAVDLATRNIGSAALFSNAPRALWAKDPLHLGTPPTGPSTLESAYSGAEILARDVTEKGPIGSIPIERAFKYLDGKILHYPRWPVWPAPAALDQTDALRKLAATMMAPPQAVLRRAVLQALRDHNVAALEDPQLSVIAAHAQDLYQAPPVLAPLGVDVAALPSGPSPAPAVEQSPGPARARAASPAPALAVRLLGAASLYARPAPARPPSLAESDTLPPLLLATSRAQGTWIDDPRTGAKNRATGHFELGEAVDPAEARFHLLAGGTALCALDRPAGLAAHVTLRGEVPVRIIQLNAFDEVLQDGFHKPGGRTLLHENAALLGFCGADPAGGEIVGWQSDTLLTQVGRYTFAAGACSVRPQATPLRRIGGREVKRGLVDGAYVVAQNQVQSGGEVSPGWIETMLPSTVEVVAVAIGGGSGEDAGRVQVRLARSSGSWDPAYEGYVAPRQVVAAQGGFLLFFAAPPVEAGGGSLGVLVHAGDGLAVRGVWARAGAVEAMATDWGRLQPQLPATEFSESAAPSFSEVHLSVAPAE